MVGATECSAAVCSGGGRWHHVAGVDGAGVAATSRAVGPTVEGEDGPDLACHAAGLAGDVTPAVAEDCLAGDSRGIVAPQVAKGPLCRVGLTPVEFDHHPPGHIPDVPVPGSAVGSILPDIAQPGRQPMAALDGAAVLEFQRRGNPGFHLLQDGEEAAPPSNPTALVDAGAHQVRGRQPPLRCPEHQVDGTGGRGGVARVEQAPAPTGPGAAAPPDGSSAVHWFGRARFADGCAHQADRAPGEIPERRRR